MIWLDWDDQALFERLFLARIRHRPIEVYRGLGEIILRGAHEADVDSDVLSRRRHAAVKRQLKEAV